MKTQKHEKFCSRNYFVPLCTYLFFGCLFVINTSINPPFCSFYFVPLYCMPERFENISTLRLQSYNSERIYFLPHETLQDHIFPFFLREWQLFFHPHTWYQVGWTWSLSMYFKLDFCLFRTWILQATQAVKFGMNWNVQVGIFLRLCIDLNSQAWFRLIS